MVEAVHQTDQALPLVAIPETPFGALQLGEGMNTNAAFREAEAQPADEWPSIPHRRRLARLSQLEGSETGKPIGFSRGIG
jgi:hypothetical protein